MDLRLIEVMLFIIQMYGIKRYCFGNNSEFEQSLNSYNEASGKLFKME